MKFISLSLFTLMLFSTSVFADYQSVSDEAQNEVKMTSEKIKAHLREAIKHSRKASDNRHKIESNPSEYDVNAVKVEWDEVIAELRAGLFCNGCQKSRSELRAEGVNFEEHIGRVGLGTSGAPQSAFDAANDKYGRKWNIANEVHETYNTERLARWTEIFRATNLTNKLHAKIQLGYDYQLKVYWPIQQDAKNVVFVNLSNLLLAQETKVLNTLKTDSSYDDYVRNRYETTEKIDSVFNELNRKRMAALRNAETKKSDSLGQINAIQILAADIGDEEVPSALVVVPSFLYKVRRDVYLGMRASERLDRMLTPQVFSLYRKAKTEGY